MKEQLEQRLQQLQQEFESGQTMLADLQAKQADLQQTLLRISGAMQVLQELMEGEPEEEPDKEPEPYVNGTVSDEEVAELVGEFAA